MTSCFLRELLPLLNINIDAVEYNNTVRFCDGLNESKRSNNSYRFTRQKCLNYSHNVVISANSTAYEIYFYFFYCFRKRFCFIFNLIGWQLSFRVTSYNHVAK